MACVGSCHFYDTLLSPLMVRCVPQVGDAAFLALLHGCSALRLLSLTGIEDGGGALTEVALETLAEGLGSTLCLERLYLKHQSKISREVHNPPPAPLHSPQTHTRPQTYTFQLCIGTCLAPQAPSSVTRGHITSAAKPAICIPRNG
jgi:hypothetical protein